MNKRTKQKRSKKADNAKLAKGAAEIEKAKAKKKTEAPPFEPIVIPESTRPIQDIIQDHVTVLPGHIGLTVADDTPIEESLRIVDWTLQLSDHCGFMVGDALNFGHRKWGEKYKTALGQTGLSRSTLKKYASTAANIPPSERIVSLSFTHHYELVPLAAPKRKEVLAELEKQAEKGDLPTKQELRVKVSKLTPKDKKKPRKITSGKGTKRKAKSEPPPYEPTPEQQSILDALENDLSEINETLKTAVELPSVHKDTKHTVVHLICNVDNKEKRRWLELLQPLVVAYNTVERCTGY